MNDQGPAVEVELVSQAVAGDEQALMRLLEEQGRSLLPEIDRQIGARHRAIIAAEDVFQISCMDAFLRIGAFQPRGPGSFSAWLRRIASNNLQDAIKELDREKRSPPGVRVEAHSEDESYLGLVENMALTTTTPSRALARGELRAGVELALSRLPREYEEALRLYEIAGLSGAEVAERMGKSHGAVRILLARARQRLGELLLENPQLFSRA